MDDDKDRLYIGTLINCIVGAYNKTDKFDKCYFDNNKYSLHTETLFNTRGAATIRFYFINNTSGVSTPTIVEISGVSMHKEYGKYINLKDKNMTKEDVINLIIGKINQVYFDLEMKGDGMFDQSGITTTGC